MITPQRSVLAIAAMALALPALAEDYRVEGGASWLDFEDVDAWGADLTVYFKPVRPDAGAPLAEAGFLTRSSNLSVNFTRDGSGDFDRAEGGLEFYADDFYLTAGASRFDNGFDVDSYRLGAGMMLSKNTRLSANWERIEPATDPNVDMFTIAAKHLMALENGRAINLEADIGAADDGDTHFAYRLQADYYPVPELGLGLRYSGIGSDDQYGLGSRYFFLPNLSGEVEWLRDDNDDNRFQVRLGARF